MCIYVPVRTWCVYLCPCEDLVCVSMSWWEEDLVCVSMSWWEEDLVIFSVLSREADSIRLSCCWLKARPRTCLLWMWMY